jgi:polysaccharide export outer membrane protein
MRKWSVALLLIVAWLPAVAAQNPAAAEKQESKEPADPGAKATKSESSSTADLKAFVLGTEDVIMIRVWREPELSGQFVIRPDGKISLPLVNEIQAAGMTPEKLAENIAEGLSKVMKRPEVSVSVQQVNSRKYFIQGEVFRTGAFPLIGPTRVLEALSNTGGFKDFANTKNIIILRGDQRLKFNYKEVIQGKKTEQNIFLERGDQIIVP